MNLEIRNTGTATLRCTVCSPNTRNNQQAYEYRFEYILSFCIPTLTTYILPFLWRIISIMQVSTSIARQ